MSGRGLCDELITRPEESYRLWCVVLCDLETLRIGAPYIYIYIYIYDISSLRVKQRFFCVILTMHLLPFHFLKTNKMHKLKYSMIRNAFCDLFYCILIGAFCWVF